MKDIFPISKTPNTLGHNSLFSRHLLKKVCIMGLKVCQTLDQQYDI